jgi:HK97 family phage major capsid protein
MELQDMNLEQVVARLAELDEEVRSAEEVEAIDAAKEEKGKLLERKAELEELEQRKANALALEKDASAAKVIDVHKEEERTMDKITAASPEYRSAWLKRMMGKELDEVEQRSIAASGVAGAIPTQTSEKIFTKIREMAPLLDEVTLLHVAGNVNFAVEGTNNDAALHTENAELTAQADTLVTVSLGGYEITKLVRISKTVQTMSINAFEGWLADLIAENIANKIEYYLIMGNGSSQPKGID